MPTIDSEKKIPANLMLPLADLENIVTYYRVFFSESYTEVGYKMLIFKSKIMILEFLSFTTPIRFVLYPGIFYSTH